ncbi:amino acid adenylation domain-containing protein [Bacillus aquiflavi]|uniref:Amino acid adenylation domain-containing protein n=1 Tax=Bacillus aquiflavi TaxID=2672567 RepID=A0A6B3VVC0_9BACI|nr:non-ribosomal peptide synthetase [Bacillus aquiflavi]MBA4536565.1 amino acid adenylation domain-containing protein [Bacillus aquiflavi]NEY80932.1 amino acid adenylation domain-containing protein [Bacillus aquiflavi]
MNKSIKTDEKSFWKKQLTGVLTKVKFPYDRLEVHQEDKVKKLTKNLSKQACDGLRQLSGHSDYKLHVLLITSLNILLYKYSGHEEIIIGSPIYKQKNKKVLINTILPLRNTVKGEMTFQQLLLQIHDTILSANKHQNYSIENMINELNTEIDQQGFPLFDVMVILDAIHDKDYVQHVKNNVTFIFSKNENGLSVTIEYRPDLYKKSTIERIAQNLDHLLQAMMFHKNNKIKDIHVLANEQYEEIFSTFNNYTKLNSEIKTLHELFQDQVVKTPNHIVAIAGNETITYKDLNEKANQLARVLREKGIARQDIVGIMVEPSIKLAIGLLAILKAGGTYLPLDPNYPKDRLTFMMQDSHVQLVLTDHKNLHRLQENVKKLNIENQAIFIGEKNDLNIRQSLHDLAYIIYTSGSTGKPKGVMVEHETASKTILWRKEEYEFTEDDGIIQLVPYSFDAFVGGFFAPIISGSKIVLLTNDEIKNPIQIRKYMKERKISHLHGVPPIISLIIEKINEDEASSLKTITVGGDRTPANLIKLCAEKQIELVNEYGPTENTIISTIYRNMNDYKNIKIGKPIYDTYIYILDKDDNLCPIGVCGEICISGGRLARGYLNRPELTAEKFVHNPFKKGQIMYRTGDLGKWCDDGNIDFIGRKDFQVKIRGFRIELGEIEKKLLAYTFVKQAAVIDCEDENGVKYLSAYFVSDQRLSVNEIKEFLSQDLPEYMVPSYFIQLQEMPMTNNGKIDRKALPTPSNAISLASQYVAPRNEIEEKIADIWTKVLNVNKIGINDNFFSIGGDSLKAIRAVSILSEQLNIEINDIYKYQTIQELASQIDYSHKGLAARIEELKQQFATASEVKINEEKAHDLEDQYRLYKKKIELYKQLNLTKTKKYDNILLTGATGYVGIYLLRELIHATDSMIHVVVRGKDLKEAEQRVKHKITFYFGNEYFDQISKRINIIKGDIEDRYLGLEKKEYETLSHEIDCIINSAAYVKHYGDFQKFYRINVQGTNHLINFAKNHKVKDFNHISTTTVSKGNIKGKDKVYFSEFEMDIGQKSNSFYAQTKLESEKLVMAASESGIEFKIFRLGNVSFHYENGTFQENIEDNAMSKTLQSFIKLNTFPELNIKDLNFSYVDQLAKSFVLLFNKKELKNEVFHLYNPYKVSIVDIANLIKKKYNTVNMISFAEFLDFILKNIHHEEIRPYLDQIFMYFHLTNKKSDVTETICLNEKTTYLLEKMNFKWSKLNETATKKMLDYWEKVNFI